MPDSDVSEKEQRSQGVSAALSPEEWRERKKEVREPLWEAAVEAGVGDGDGVGVLDDSHYTYVHNDLRHALAALCLHGQPFGFTWEMVDDIRRAVRFSQEAAEASCGVAGYREACPECQEAVDRYKDRLNAIADKLESLLPPREET